jgi:hypothetical protein
VKPFLTFILLISFATGFSQWTRVLQLPSSDISSLYHKGHLLYAGGKNIIYKSGDDGMTWDSTGTIPQFFLVTSIIVYNNELYAAAPHKGVSKSSDGGTTWQIINTGLFPDVADFCEFKGDLYAATLGNSVYKLNPANGNSWLFFGNGLSSLSANIPTIGSNSNAMVAGTLANGIYGQLPANSTIWDERLLTGQISPNEGAYDIVNAHDTIFYSGRTGKFYRSTDNGLSWNFIGNPLVSAATSMANAKQALIVSRHIFQGTFKTIFYYIKKDALQNPFVNFSEVADDHFTYKIDILGNRLWDASNRGLFFMSLSDLPGISSADDTTTSVVLPTHFSGINSRCQGSKQFISWKTTPEQNSGYFTIERSTDVIRWVMIGTQPAVGNSTTANEYLFADDKPLQNSYYRITQYDLDNKIRYRNIIRSSCNQVQNITISQNPFQDRLSINVIAERSSQLYIKVIDSKGTIVKLQTAHVIQGNNQLVVDINFLPAGQYLLSAIWNSGQMQKAIQVYKL